MPLDTELPAVLVVGAGTAGAATALFLAAKGVPTLLVDARQRANVGASWVNGIELSLFDELDLPRPPEGVLFAHARRFVMQPPGDAPRVVVEQPATAEFDMRALNAWLIDLAIERGVQTRFNCPARIDHIDETGAFVTLHQHRARFELVVDAAGITAHNREHWNPGLDICSAFQGVYRVTSTGQARDFMGRHRVAELENWSQPAVEGGYSVLNAMLDRDAEHVAILAGAMKRPGLRSGARIASDFVRGQPWIGARVFGGGGLIPLRPPRRPLVEDRVVRVGNAAGQVFPQHGSGVAPGLRAAWHAAQAIAGASQLADYSTRGLWAYAANYERTAGAICAHYQPLRYVSSSLLPEQAALLARAGIIGPTSVATALAQLPMRGDPTAAIGVIRHARELAPLLPRLSMATALAFEMLRHWRSFPTRGPGPELDRWQRHADRLMQRAALLSGYVDPTPSDPEAWSTDEAPV